MLSVDVARALLSVPNPVLRVRERAEDEMVGLDALRVTALCDLGLVGGEGELPLVALRLPEESNVVDMGGSSRGVCANENRDPLRAIVGTAGAFLIVGVVTFSSSADLSWKRAISV